MSSHSPDAVGTGAPKRIVEEGYDRVADEYARLEEVGAGPQTMRRRHMERNADIAGQAVAEPSCESKGE